ncbi:MAG: putative toxin-antitoxin system toxin component, PIN family [Ottowia sp.]|uniref:putative toxin-antitoxin system toxin component, PIN family n=1 Tax=Ottowia sp. TaxID=1898956 RepID=UPI0039E25209
MNNPAVIDTNVLVAALIAPRKDTPPAHVVRSMLKGGFPFVMSEALLAEYRDVLSRAKLRKAHGLAPADLESLLVDLTQLAIMLAPALGPVAPDPGDQHLWDLLAARDDLVLVTGDKLLLTSAMRQRILTPQQFLAM